MTPWDEALPALYAAVNAAQRSGGGKQGEADASALFAALACARSNGGINVLVDFLLVELDGIISRQLNAIMHHDRFSGLERAWRSLAYLIDRVDFSQNIRLVFMNLSMEDLRSDFEDAPDITRSGLFKHVYTAEYGQYGGQPIAAIVADYEFSAGKADVDLLYQASRVAAMAHSPFLASVGRRFFDLTDWPQLTSMGSLKSLLGLPRYAAWRKFRENEVSRYAALALPVFLLRLPYGRGRKEAGSFAFEEDASDFEKLCWGRAVFFLAVRMAESFADRRWCTDLTGVREETDKPRFPQYDFDATPNIQSRIPTGIAISESLEHKLSEQGFMALVLRRSRGDAAFFSANSCNKSSSMAVAGHSANDEQMGQALAAQLPYMMVVNRIAHYIKVIQRDNIGSWRDARTVEQELNKWINCYVTEMDDPDPVTRGRRPLRKAKITVYNTEDSSQWYSVNIQVRPHFKYLGATFTLSLLSRLEK